MQQGMSLIELLIVLAVTGMLAAIAYPSYSDQLRRAARSEVVGLLHDAALTLERHRTRTGSYAEGDPALPGGNHHYRLDVERHADSFMLRARRQPQGLMAADRCADYTLDQAGRQANPGAPSGAMGCWGS